MAYQPYISEQDSANKRKQFHRQQNPRTPFMQPTGNKIIPYAGLTASEAYTKNTYPERYNKQFSNVNSDQLLNPGVINSFPISGLQQFPNLPTQVDTSVVNTTPTFSKDFNIDGLNLGLGLPQRNPLDFNIDNPFTSNQQNTEVQAPIIKADTSNPDTAHNDFMQRYLEQAANNSVGMQGMNAANSATAYNNMLEAGIARGANSRSKGSYRPTYQKAVAYTPQAMNFGSNQQQASNPYLGVFDGKGISVAPSKNTVYPQGMEMSQNGKSLFDSNRNLLPNKQLSNQMKNWFGG